MQLERPAILDIPLLNVMNFLNEVVLWYPQAISFAPGRPTEQHFDVAGEWEHLTRYVTHAAAKHGVPPATVYAQLGQYQKTNGIINQLIAQFLAHDEQIKVAPQSIMVTDGAQEAMTVITAGLFNRTTDVLLVQDPAYIGMTGIATILGIELCPVPTGTEGLDLAALVVAIDTLRAAGKTPKALYLVPDFSNPLGSSMTLADRHQLLTIAHAEQLLIIEDNPYGMFAFDEPPASTLKALDQTGCVIYLGTFSKMLYPGLRVGFMVADQVVVDHAGKPTTLAEELSRVKSLTSVNTSPLLQAMVGGMLLAHDCSLRATVQAKLPFYRTNRDTMLASLTEHFAHDPLLADRVRWSVPGGGFFLTVELPFVFGQAALQTCAEHYGVICCPMTFFSLLPGREHEIRLSFSYVTPHQIKQGIRQLWQFVHDQVAHQAA